MSPSRGLGAIRSAGRVILLPRGAAHLGAKGGRCRRWVCAVATCIASRVRNSVGGMVQATDVMVSASTSVSIVDTRCRAAAADPARAAARTSSIWPMVLVVRGSSRCALSRVINAADSCSATMSFTHSRRVDVDHRSEALLVKYRRQRWSFDEVGRSQRHSRCRGGDKLAFRDKPVSSLLGGCERHQAGYWPTAVDDLDRRSWFNFRNPRAGVLAQFTNTDLLHALEQHMMCYFMLTPCLGSRAARAGRTVVCQGDSHDG
jgi:hypothetical protein